MASGTSSISVNRSGVNLPCEGKASRVFAKLFLEGTPDEIKQSTAVQEAYLGGVHGVIDA